MAEAEAAAAAAEAEAAMKEEEAAAAAEILAGYVATLSANALHITDSVLPARLAPKP